MNAAIRLIVGILLLSVSVWGHADPASYATIQVIPHIASNNHWYTLLETINGDADTHTFTFVAKDPTGTEIASLQQSIPGNGSIQFRVRDLFPTAHMNVKRIEIKAEPYLAGKLYTAQRFAFASGGEQTGLMVGLPEPRAILSVPHITPSSEASPWWTGLALTNIGTVPVHVFFRDDAGNWMLLREDLGPNEQFAFVTRDVLGADSTVKAGDVFAYTTDATLDNGNKRVTGGWPINALAGETAYGMRPTQSNPDAGYGFSEAYQLRGWQVDELGNIITHNFGSSHYVPLDQVSGMTGMLRDTAEWDGVAYRNVTGQRQRLRIRHYDSTGTRQLVNGEGTLWMDVDPGTRVVFVPDSIGFDTSFPGMLVLDVVDAWGMPLPDAIGDTIYLNGDLEDEVKGRSALGGGDVPTNLAQSRHLRLPVTLDSGNSGVVTVFNPTDSAVTVSVEARDTAGTAHAIDGALLNVELPPNGFRTINVSDLFATPTTFSGTISISAEAGAILGLANRYTITETKDTTNINGLVLAPCNPPDGLYGISPVAMNGEFTPESWATTATDDNHFVMSYETLNGDIPVNQTQLMVNGVPAVTQLSGEAGFSGEAAFDHVFEATGEATVTFQLFADDGNTIPDAARTESITVGEAPILAALTYFDSEHNPTDTLKVNEPFYVAYDIHRTDGGEIAEVQLMMSPDDGATDDDIRFTVPSPGNSVAGEVFVEAGISYTQSDSMKVNLLRIRPEVLVFNTVLESAPAQVTTGIYQLPAERVYVETENHVLYTRLNASAVAEIISRPGVLVDGNRQLTLSEATAMVQYALTSTGFYGVQLNDYLNSVTISTSEGDFRGTLGGQTYGAEQNVDDLKVLYHFDE